MPAPAEREFMAKPDQQFDRSAIDAAAHALRGAGVSIVYSPSPPPTPAKALKKPPQLALPMDVVEVAIGTLARPWGATPAERPWTSPVPRTWASPNPK